MKNITIFILSFYKKFISPLFEAVFGKACRFSPTCSQYTLDMVKKYGAGKGLYLGARQLSKCHYF